MDACCPEARASRRSRQARAARTAILTSVSYMALLPEMLAMRPPASTLAWTEYPVGTDICASGAGTWAAGFWAAAMPVIKMATPMPPAMRWIIAEEGC